jgi:NAD(P)-dependent dehydrogenase (short-subunit alcohol dehydrogenase family)
MSMRFSGKTFLVTGATSGIGNATSESLMGEGAHVIAVGRSHSRLTAMANHWGEQCTTIEYDLTNPSALPTIVENVPEIHGAVMSAGIVKNNPIKFFNRATFDEMLSVNLISPLLLLVELANRRRLRAGGSVVFLSSITGTSIGMKGTLAYATTKAGLSGAIKVFALELASKGIRVNCIAPGMVETPMVQNANELSAEMIRADKAKYPLGKRYAAPEEVAKAIMFLLSDESSFITGQTVTIDGGYTIQ